MKASVVGLFVATAAFGSSSIYLWSQLQDERTRAEEFAATGRKNSPPGALS